MSEERNVLAEAAGESEVEELNGDKNGVLKANASLAADNDRLRSEVAELRELLRQSSNSMEMVVQWLGKFPEWQKCIRSSVARNRKALVGEGAIRDDA